MALTQVTSATFYGQATLALRRKNTPERANRSPMVPIPVGPNNGTSEAATSVAGDCVTVNVYVWVVPSCAVTSKVMTLSPGLRVIGALAVPDGTAAPFTVTVAVESSTVGVTVSVLVV